MQPKVNVSNIDTKRNPTNHIAWLLERFGSGLPILLPALVICLLAHIGHGTTVAQSPASQPTASAAQTDARKAFEKMKTLAGSWQGTIMGISIDVTIRVVSSGTAILHEANTTGEGPPKHEITMFYVEGDRLLAIHYCDAGNRARFEGKISADGKTSEFNFLDVTGSTRGGLVKRLAFTVIDANKHVVDFTFIKPDGAPIELRGEFQRTTPV
ncbi:MAG TPA: hypothetical protein VFI24_03045 [Pyrinomonadaceae bacterium]|nr:hypothetical protein [Pyrinomonadaceae bacterium]